MAGNKYVTKGYSTYTDIPARQGGYGHGPKNPVNQYEVETTKLERVRTPAAGYTNFGGSPSKIELLKEFVHAPGKSTRPEYATKDHYEGYDPNYRPDYENSSPPRYQGRDIVKKVPVKTSNFYGSNEYHTSSPVHSYPSEESHFPNKYYPPSTGSEGARHVRTGNFSGPGESWQSAGPPRTHHPVTTSTNNINEALGFLQDSVYYSPRADPRRRGVLDDLSTRAQPIEPERRYAKPAFVGKTN